jgi:hypothetical protein
MTTLKICLLLVVISLLLPGCASLTSSQQQGMILETKNNRNEGNTVCTAENSRGEYILSPGKRGKVDRSRDKLHIECVNGTQFGYLDVEARRRNVTKLFNFFIDMCSISCAIDRNTGKGYGYTPRQTVYMMESRHVQ